MIGIQAPAFLPVCMVVVPASAVPVVKPRRRLRDRNEFFRQQVEHLSSRSTR